MTCVLPSSWPLWTQALHGTSTLHRTQALHSSQALKTQVVAGAGKRDKRETAAFTCRPLSKVRSYCCNLSTALIYQKANGGPSNAELAALRRKIANISAIRYRIIMATFETTEAATWSWIHSVWNQQQTVLETDAEWKRKLWAIERKRTSEGLFAIKVLFRMITKP